MSTGLLEPGDAHERFVGYLLRLSKPVASSIAPGFIAGLIAGGVGSRIAMRVMAVTSNASVQGIKTDFGATVGEITPDGTLFLLLAGCVIGILGGLIFLAVGRWLPGKGWLRGLLFGGLLLAVFGRLIIDPENRDFVFLDPAALAIGMFGGIFMGYGLLFMILHEWIGHRIIAARTGSWAPSALVIVLLIPLLLTGILAIFLVASVLVGFAINHTQTFMNLWSTRSVEIAGYVVLISFSTFGLVQLAEAIVEML